MGTEVQSEMYLPGYYALRGLNDSTGNGNWSLHQQNDMFGQFHDFFLTRPAADANEGYDREQLRQTILTHESVFRHQLHELHRLYRTQRDMMNEMRSKELQRHMMQGEASQFGFYSSAMPVAEDNAVQKTSNLFLNHGRLSMSSADTDRCDFRSMKENILQSNYGPDQNGLRLKNCETLESGCKKLQRRLFDLELPADAYFNNEEEGPGLSGGSVIESYLLSRNHEVTFDRDGNLSTHTDVNSGCNGDVPDANMHVRNLQGWRNLNEPIKHNEASASTSTDVLGNIMCPKKEMDRRVLSSNSLSGFQCLAKFSQDLPKEREAGVSLSNLHLETERRQNGWLAYNTEAGQHANKGLSLSASFCPEDFPATSKSQQTERRNSNEPVKKLFGVQIFERNHGASVEDSHNQQSLVPQSIVENSESSLISSWKKLHAGINQFATMDQENLSFGSFSPSNKSSVTLLESPEGAPNKLLVSSNLRSIPSIRTEASSQNHLCHISELESKESWVCYSSNGFGHLHGSSEGSSASEKHARDGPKNTCQDLGSMMDAKSSDKKRADAVPPNGYQNEAVIQSAAASANGSCKQSPQRGLPWLKVVPSCNGSSSEERQGSSQMNMDSLRNHFQQLVDQTEMMRKSSFQSCVQDSSSVTCAFDAANQRTGVGECSGNRKILGCSIYEKPSISADHLSPSAISNPSVPAPVTSDTDSLKAGSHDTKAPDEMSPKLVVQLGVEGQIGKGLIKFSADSRRQIDLNTSVDDDGLQEETQPTTCASSRTSLKISVEIDLEAPVVDETELVVAPGFESSESIGLEAPVVDETKLDVAPGFESSESKLPHGFESFQSKHPPASESVRSNIPPGFESFQSKHPPGSKSVQSNLPPGFESFQSKHTPCSKSVQSELPPGFESFHSDFPPGFESFQCKCKKPVDTRQDDPREAQEGLITVAAEALVDISSSHLPLQVDSFCRQSEASSGDHLLWFAEIISSYKGDNKNEIELVSTGKDSVHEDVLPDGMDYFEYMTLNLVEAKVEEIGTYKPQIFEDSKNQNILLKRPRRGQARRGRQRKDFQRDVLPTLSSLLINEVTVEGLIQATGSTWKSSLALKKTRNGGGRRKRRLQDSDSAQNATESFPHQAQLPNCREVAIEDHTSLFGWGKRTRRPPRHRYPIPNPTLIIK